jgi:hypothetical protein
MNRNRRSCSSGIVGHDAPEYPVARHDASCRRRHLIAQRPASPHTRRCTIACFAYRRVTPRVRRGAAFASTPCSRRYACRDKAFLMSRPETSFDVILSIQNPCPARKSQPDLTLLIAFGARQKCRLASVRFKCVNWHCVRGLILKFITLP